MTRDIFPDVPASMTSPARRDWLRRYEETVSRRDFVVALHGWLATTPWEWFGHLTLSECETLVLMGKLVRHWRHDVNRRLFGRDFWKDKRLGVSAFYVCERQDRGDYHAHVLVTDTAGASPSVGETVWNLGRGSGAPVRTAQVVRYHGGGSIGYCVNYLDNRNPDVAWDLLGPRFE